LASEKSVWVIAEHSEEQVKETSLEVLSCGRRLADYLDGHTVAVILGNNRQTLADTLGSYGADKVFFISSPRLQEYRAEFYVESLVKIFTDENPEIVLCGATLTGRDLAPRLAARLHTGLISDCTSLELNDEGLLSGSKPTYGGRITSTIVFPPTKPQMATIKPDIMRAGRPDDTRRPEVIVITPQLNHVELRTSLKSIIKADPENVGLDEAEIIIAGGRGMGSQANFQLLEELARHLGGVMAGSLGAVDEGWIPRRKLVGQTGTTVTPKLYLACGISGSVYHVLGMRDAEFVIAIDKDPDAPIFKVADISIIGDVVEVISAINERLRELTGNTDTRSRD
jgi:electron transfer flavoprotein alpha subunit